MKKNLSKLLALALAFALTLSLTACGGGDKPAENPAGNSNISVETPDTNDDTVVSTPVETPEQPEEPEEIEIIAVPGEIKAVAGETYNVDDRLEITFGEMEFSNYTYYYSIAAEETYCYFDIKLPITVHNTSAETIDYFNMLNLNDRNWGVYDSNHESLTHLHNWNHDKSIASSETHNTVFDANMTCVNYPDYGVFNTQTGYMYINICNTVFVIPYDAAEFLASNGYTVPAE